MNTFRTLTLALAATGFFHAAFSQSPMAPNDSSKLSGIKMNKQVMIDNRGFFVGIAKATLELETGDNSIDQLEVYIWKNPVNQKAASESWFSELRSSLESRGWKLETSSRDPSFTYLKRNGQQLLMYTAPGKKEANLYLGLLKSANQPILTSTQTGTGTNGSPAVSAASTPAATPYSGGLIGNWGDLSGSKIDFYDSHSNVRLPGVSRSAGIEFKPDGSYIQLMLVTSGYPDYKIYSYIIGKYRVEGNTVKFMPEQRRYRKWQNKVLVTDEMDKPASQTNYWEVAIHEVTGKRCLYLRGPEEETARQYCLEH